MRIRLLALDMDDTALDSRHRMTARTRQAIERAVRQGIQVVPATGRCLDGMPRALKGMPGIRYIITSNGARITDADDNTTIFERLIPCEVAASVLEKCGELPVWMSIHANGHCYDMSRIQALYRRVVYKRDFARHRLIKNLSEHVQATGTNVEKLQVFSPLPAVLAKVMEVLRQYPQVTPALSSRIYVEINRVGADKGGALAALCGRLGIDREEVMAVGDSSNDLTMLRFAGLPVAMGNATAEIKAIVGRITSSNADDGVVEAIFTHLLAEAESDDGTLEKSAADRKPAGRQARAQARRE